jgi:hypothetical protein
MGSGQCGGDATKYLSMEDYRQVRQYYQAETFECLVEAICKSEFLPQASVADYMQGVAERSRMWDGGIVRTDSAEHFLRDLQARGAVRFEVPQ